MELLSFVVLLLIIIPAASYAWGMRGTTIGGEKGAMLPGAIIGLLLAVNSNILVIRENFIIFTALGAVGMFFGGAMTYGETLGLSMQTRPAENMKKGLIALFVKGFCWFGAFGSVFSIGFLSICHVLSLTEILITIALVPVLMLLFYFIFNKPMKPAENKFPKIYFSKTRDECWGGIFGLTVLGIAVSIYKSSFFGIVFTVGCALFGAFGWVIAQLCQIFSKHYAEESSSYVLRKLSHKNGVEPWKFMECVLGAFGGLGAAVSFNIGYDDFCQTALLLESNNHDPHLYGSLSNILLAVWMVLLAVDMLHYYIQKPKNCDQLKKDFLNGVIDQIQYDKLLKKAESGVSSKIKLINNVSEAAEIPLYGGIPLIFILLGDVTACEITALFILMWILFQEVCYEKTVKNGIITHVSRIVFAAFCFALLSASFLTTFRFSPFFTFIVLAAGYEVITLIWMILRKYFDKKEKNESSSFGETLVKDFIKNKYFLTVHGFFVICVILTIIFFRYFITDFFIVM